MAVKNGERGLRDHLSRRITNALTPAAKFSIADGTLRGGEQERGPEQLPWRLVAPPTLRGSGGPTPPPRRGWAVGAGRGRAPPTCHSAGRGRSPPPAPRLTGTSGPPPPPLRLRLRQLKSQQGPATWARPAGPLRGGRRVAALRARREELRGVCWSRSLGGPPTRA